MSAFRRWGTMAASECVRTGCSHGALGEFAVTGAEDPIIIPLTAVVPAASGA